jgi:hypothetical protein
MIRPTKRQRVECPPSWLDCATLQAVPAAASRSTTTHVAPNNVSGMIRTPMASSTTKDIFLDRLRKEVVDKYKFSVASPKATTSAAGTGGGTAVGSMKDMSDGNDKADDPVHSQQRIRALLRRRIAIGLNECTRALESAVGRQRRTRGETLTNRGCQEPANTTMNQTDEALDVEFDGGPLLVVVAAEGMRPSPLPVVHIPVLASELSIPLLLLPEPSTRRELGRILGIKSASVLTFLSRSSPQPRSTQTCPPHEDGGRAGASSSSGVSELLNGHSVTPEDRLSIDPHDDDIRQANAGLDSFIKFVCGKVEATAPPATLASAR